MIENARQYALTKRWYEQFQQDAEAMRAMDPPERRTQMFQLQIDAAQSQADSLSEEIAAYEKTHGRVAE